MSVLFDTLLMGLSHVQRYCMGGDEEEEVCENRRYIVLQEDFKYFEEERWFSFQSPILFDHNIFIFLYPHYKQEQSEILARWDASIDIKSLELGENKNEEDTLSLRWKYAIRRGVPLQYYKTLITVIFNKNFANSKNIYERARTETNFNLPVPLFGLDEAPKNALLAPFLNHKGHKSLQDILHVLRAMKSHFYNRYISQVISLLLVFFEEAQVYDLVATMVQESTGITKARSESMRWHFAFKEQQMKSMASSFYKIVGHNSPTVRGIAKALQGNSVDKKELFLRVVENFFYGYLSFPFILRIFPIFLNEGVKIFYRIFYVMLVLSEKELKEATSIERACLVLRKKCLAISSKQINIFLKKSFNLNLKAFVSPTLLESRLKKSQMYANLVYLPYISGVSHILSYQDLEVIWGYLPFELKTYDLKLLYPTFEPAQKKKLNLTDLLKTLETPEFSLIIIRTIRDGEIYVFGAFILGKVTSQEGSQWYGNKENFLFTLLPEASKYSSTRQNSHYIFTGRGTLLMGSGPSGNAIQLNSDLTKGASFKTLTFKNEPLSGCEGEFQIDHIEAFQIY